MIKTITVSYAMLIGIERIILFDNLHQVQGFIVNGEILSIADAGPILTALILQPLRVPNLNANYHKQYNPSPTNNNTNNIPPQSPTLSTLSGTTITSNSDNSDTNITNNITNSSNNIINNKYINKTKETIELVIDEETPEPSLPLLFAPEYIPSI